MAEKVAKAGIKRKKGYLYYVDKKGNVVETKMARGASKGGGGKVIAKTGVKKDKGIFTSSTRLVTLQELRC